MKIGRTSENDLVLHDHGVSRRHARITARDGRYFAEDVGSANGTQLNGQLLSGEKQLRDGDRITVGPVEFTFVWMPPEDDDDVTRPIRRALAPPNAKVSPQGVEQASLAEIEAAPTSFQQSMPAMARPASAPRPGMAVPAAKGGATPAMPMPAATPKRPSAPDLPAVSAPAPVAAAPARTPQGPVLGASAPGTAAPPKPPAGPPVLGAPSPAAAPVRAPVQGASAPGAATSPRPPAGPPGLGASAPGAATPPKTPSGPPALGASASAASGKVPAAPPVLGASASGAPARTPAGPPVLGPSVPGAGAPAKAPGGPPALSASTANKASGASASVRASGPGLAAVGASGPGRSSAPGTASEPAHITALELPAAGTPASTGAAHVAPPAPEKVAAPVPAKQNAVPNLPGVGAPALNRPSLGLGAARASAAPGARGGAASSPGLPLMTPPGLMAPPPPARPSVVPPPVDLAPVVPDEPEERTLMAISTVDSPVPAAAPPPVLPLPELDEPEERTLMAISTVDSPVSAAPPPVLPLLELDEPEERTLMAISTVDSPVPAAPPPVLPPPELDEPEERTLMAIPATPEAPPLEKALPPQDASPALLPPVMEEPEERTVLDLRPITPVRPLVAPPVRVVSAPSAISSSEPSTFVGQDDDLSSAPEETRASGTFTGQVAPGTAAPAVAPPPAWSPPVPPPSPEPVTFVGRERAAPAPTLEPGPLPGEPPLPAHAPAPNGEGGALQPVPADREDSFVQPVPNGPVTVVAKVEPSSAADKARRRRQLARSLQGQLVLFWQRQSLPKRIGFASLAAVVVLGVVTLLVALVSPTAIRLPGREPSKLGMEPVTDSFGLGEDVRWVHVDDKLFDFRFVSPTRAVAVLHYQASNIARDEVNLSLNGVSLGWVPPDTAQTAERELEQILPPSLLRRNANNQLLFDNALNPPGRDPWRIWNLRLEIIPVPEASPEQLILSAREAAKAGARFYELKDVGAENLFKAWREYRAAWITLEALDEKPELYEDVRERIAQISTELDHRCSQLMMQFQRAVQFRSRRDAVATLEDVRRRFPTAEHRCHNLAQEKAYEHEL
ncbi:FHA domain-containing protein [Corallococcus sp. CA054B]|uniref:FHA domain-containing protein n=1 Tax=Corallococcus sp. CA054B TaxID=2316734 RepID=UPI001F3C0C3C